MADEPLGPEGEVDAVEDRYSEFHEWMSTSPQVYRGALDAAVQHQLAAAVDTQLQPWRPIGPRNVGGAVRCIVQDPRTPTTLYAGSAQGGVWKTEDDGYFWRPVSPPGMLVPVAALAMAPTNSQVLYAGTGDTLYGGLAGRGIWSTTTGGNAWVQMVVPPPHRARPHRRPPRREPRTSTVGSSSIP